MNRAGLEELLATFLRYGTWLASAAIGLGSVLELICSNLRMPNLASLANLRITRMGIALLIVLPVLRVLLMLLVFIRERDFRFASIAGLVFVIIVVGIVWGFSATSAMAG